MSALSDARNELHASLVASAAGTPIAERVHRVTPDRADPPCVFIGGASVDREQVGSPGVSLIVVGLPVYLVADGRPSAQTLTLDDMISLAWDAALDIGARPVDARPAPIDVGGPNMRGAIVQVETTIRALTLCAPVLMEVSR